jgi:secreted PhoX family phosphatase
MEPTTLPEGASETTRRSFIRGVAAAGASTAAAVALDKAGVLDLATAEAAEAGPNAFSSFRAIAASTADAFQVPEGYRADVLIGWGDQFANADGTTYTYGFNNDFLAYFPLRDSDEGLLFVNHEYPSPFFQHGVTTAADKTPEQIALEQDAVGNAIVHVRRNGDGVFEVVSPSPYNRRITGRTPDFALTGPLAGNPAYAGVGTEASGSLANCSGGITPWGTALSCEENYQDMVPTYGWSEDKAGTPDYVDGDGSNPATQPAKYGWVCEHDPFDPSSEPRKHTALGRFRHENTAFRARPDRSFVLYMGDDRNDGGVYKFVSALPFRPGHRTENLRILTEGKLYVARWEPDGRREFDASGNLISATSGTGTWREVVVDELVDAHARIGAAVGADEWLAHYATNRPEDVEVDEDGTVYIALTNNNVSTSATNARDVHGSIRRLREADDDPTAMSFSWEDFAAGGPSGRSDPGEQGFSSPDNLVFDKAGNVWVVTDISSSALNVNDPVKFHANNAVFMVPRTGPNAGVAFRFANMPVHAEGTGPYFTPDEKTLFVNVQHPGEESEGDPNDVQAYTSWWPQGNRTAGQTPAKPIPSTVMITKVPPRSPDPGSPVIPPPPPAGGPDRRGPRVELLSAGRQRLSRLRSSGVSFRIRVDEPATITATIAGRLRNRRGKLGKSRRLVRVTVRADRPGEVNVRLRPKTATRLLLRRQKKVNATLTLRATDRAGNVTNRTKRMRFS